MPFGIDLANNYPIILAFLALAVLVLGWKWWNERDAVDIGLKIQDKVREMLGEFKCAINGDQVSCKRGFASLGKNFSLKEAADMVVRTLTSRMSVVDPSAGRPPAGYPPPMQGPPRQQPMYPPGVQQGAPASMAEQAMPPSASAASASVSPSLGGVGGFGGLDGAGGFGGSGGTGGLAAAPSQASSMHMGGGGLINPGTSGAPPSLPPELQPIETSVRDGGMGGAMGAMGGMGGMGGGGYDPDSF